MMRLTLPFWHDLHVHFRQGDVMASFIRDHLDMGCASVLAMPNTKPPVGKVFRGDVADCWSVEAYRDQILAAGGDAFDDIIVPLYLTKDTTPEMIEKGAGSGLLRACKYYPPHGTTGAEFSLPFEALLESGIFRSMEANGVVLCVHGEEHGLPAERYFGRGENAEEIFYRERLPRLADACPDLKVVGEHITTKAGAEFIRAAGGNFRASVTPQHLLYTAGHLLQGLKYHLYCLPLVKFEEDRAALRAAVTAPGNSQFFAGTDSAPHTAKATACGCAAGCYTGGIAPQLYAAGFEAAGVDLSTPEGASRLSRFQTDIGGDFYGLKKPERVFTLIRETSRVSVLQTPSGPVVPLPVGLEGNGVDPVDIPWSFQAS